MTPSPQEVPLVVSVGEFLWDALPHGRRPGGAPYNFARHAHALGARAHLVSAVGDDPPGHELLAAAGLPTGTISVSAHHPTSTVHIATGPGGQPTYTIGEGVAWDDLTPTPEAAACAACADALCFGTLGQRHPTARAATRALIRSTKPGALRVFDANLRQHFFSTPLIRECLDLATVLKLSDEELPVLSPTDPDPRTALPALAETFGLQAIAYTRGRRGALLLAGNQFSEHPGFPVEPQDTVGAGDAFLAAFTLGLLEQRPLDAINEAANRYAARSLTPRSPAP